MDNQKLRADLARLDLDVQKPMGILDVHKSLEDSMILAVCLNMALIMRETDTFAARMYSGKCVVHKLVAILERLDSDVEKPLADSIIAQAHFRHLEDACIV